MILVFDTETTGLVDFKRPAPDPAQPHLVELGAILYTSAGVEVSSINLVIRPDGYEIPPRMAEIHGISTGMAMLYGVPLVVALAVFCNLRSGAEEVVGHNLEFDRMIIETAIARTGRTPSSGWPPRMTCTKELCEPICKLPPSARMTAAGRGHQFKSPNLTEAHTHLFGEGFSGAHGALADARACARVFWEVRRLQAIAKQPAGVA